jgi:hypothetical protein
MLLPAVDDCVLLADPEQDAARLDAASRLAAAGARHVMAAVATEPDRAAA